MRVLRKSVQACEGNLALPGHELLGLSRHLSIGLVQALHRFDVWVSRTSEGKSSRAFVGELTEEEALKQASKLVSETFVFTVRGYAGSRCQGIHM